MPLTYSKVPSLYLTRKFARTSINPHSLPHRNYFCSRQQPQFATEFSADIFITPILSRSDVQREPDSVSNHSLRHLWFHFSDVPLSYLDVGSWVPRSNGYAASSLHDASHSNAA